METFILILQQYVPLEQNQPLDVRGFYETANSSGTYKRVVSQKAILINDKVRVR